MDTHVPAPPHIAPDLEEISKEVLAEQLPQALGNGEFELLYQPQNSLDTGAIIGAEALLRWHHPKWGMIPPGLFIPIAEESDTIIPIGAWTIQQACWQNKQWQTQGLPPIRMAVNLSARQLRHPRLLAETQRALTETGLAPHYLELELTESGLVHDLYGASETCKQLKALGIKLSLDDFGTGYSSLTYVSRFPFDKLKIDQSFVHDIIHNPVNAAIARAAIVLAQGLNIFVLAEGVETTAQAQFLRSSHCHAMQGYLFSKPIKPEAFAALLAEGRGLQLPEIPPQDQRYLLLVDDEPSILSALTRVLRSEGYQVLSCTSCTAAFELLTAYPIDVVISDQRMPGMSGTEFLSQVRKLYPHTIRIVLSGYADMSSVIDAINHGEVYRFFTKPWHEEQLREQIREAFRLSGKQSDKARADTFSQTGSPL